MTNILRIILISIVASIVNLFFTSCTDVIDVDVPEAEPRLVIEASIDWEKGGTANNQNIKLSTSTPYFDQVINTNVTGASVIVSNDTDDTQYVFTDQNDGNYTIANFIPILNQSYTLEVLYNGETYTAQETLMPVVDIESVYQTTEKGASDVLEINIDFQDPEGEANFYFLKIKEQADFLPTLFDMNDEFIDGNLVNIFHERFEDEDINQLEYLPGDIVSIEFYGVSDQYSEFIKLLIEQSSSFGSTPVPLKGNCINVSDPDNYALGYFRLAQVVKTNYTFQ